MNKFFSTRSLENLTKDLQSWFCNRVDEYAPVYLVGGAVRDLLLGRPAKDLDLVHSDAKKFAIALAKINNGAFVPLFEKDTIKCTYRVVRNHGGSRQELDISTFQGQNIIEDLAKRDFTINGMALVIDKNGFPQELIDPWGGTQDILEYKLVKLVSLDSLKDDPLRILRAYRFSAAFGFSLSPLLIPNIIKHRSLLDDVAAERKLEEIIKIFSSSSAYHIICQMDEHQVLEGLFPELTACKGCDQNYQHHLDVFGHSLVVLKECEKIILNPQQYFGEFGQEVGEYLKSKNKFTILKISALLHDIGKPLTRIVETDGRITFHGHDRSGSTMAATLCSRLKMSRKDSDFLQMIVGRHLEFFLLLNQNNIKNKTLMRWFRNHGDDVLALFVHAMADVLATCGPASSKQYRRDFLAMIQARTGEYLTKARKVLTRENLVSGKDLLAIGMKPGVEMGRVLQIIRQAQDNGDISKKAEALALGRKLAPL